MAELDSDGFITLPPGIFDPSTIKAAPRPERTRKKPDDIVFMPMTPGMAPPAAPTPPAPAAPAAPAYVETPLEMTATAARPVPRWSLRFPDGSESIVTRLVLIGRHPAASADWPGAELLAVSDSTNSVSKTHAAFEADESGLWVHDLGSTNGVWVVSGNDVTEAVAGRRVRVPAGASVELGDFIFTVAQA